MKRNAVEERIYTRRILLVGRKRVIGQRLQHQPDMHIRSAIIECGIECRQSLNGCKTGIDYGAVPVCAIRPQQALQLIAVFIDELRIFNDVSLNEIITTR